MITDDQYEKLVADGLIKPEELDDEKKKTWEETDQIFDLATKTKYQLTSGHQRTLDIPDPEALFEASGKVPLHRLCAESDTDAVPPHGVDQTGD